MLVSFSSLTIPWCKANLLVVPYRDDGIKHCSSSTRDQGDEKQSKQKKGKMAGN